MHGLSARLCSVPCRYTAGFVPCQSALSTSALSAYRLHARPPLLYMRAWIFAYANLLDSFVRCVRTRGMDKAMGRDGLDFFALPDARAHLPRTASCDSVAYAEGVQKRNAFLFLSFSYFSDRRKVPYAFWYFSYKVIITQFIIILKK